MGSDEYNKSIRNIHNKDIHHTGGIAKLNIMGTAEIKLAEWLNENQETVGICTKDDAKYGCGMCQEFYQILDEIKKEHAKLFLLAATKFKANSAEMLYTEWINLL